MFAHPQTAAFLFSALIIAGFSSQCKTFLRSLGRKSAAPDGAAPVSHRPSCSFRMATNVPLSSAPRIRTFADMYSQIISTTTVPMDP